MVVSETGRFSQVCIARGFAQQRGYGPRELTSCGVTCEQKSVSALTQCPAYSAGVCHKCRSPMCARFADHVRRAIRPRWKHEKMRLKVECRQTRAVVGIRLVETRHDTHIFGNGLFRRTTDDSQRRLDSLTSQRCSSRDSDVPALSLPVVTYKQQPAVALVSNARCFQERRHLFHVRAIGRHVDLRFGYAVMLERGSRRPDRGVADQVSTLECELLQSLRDTRVPTR